MLLLQFLLLSQPFLIVSFENFLLLYLILNLWLFLLVICKTARLFGMKFLCFLNQLMDIKFESLGKHLVDHSNLVCIGIQVTQFIFFFILFSRVFNRSFCLSIILQGLILVGRKAKLTILIHRLRLNRLYLTSLLLHHLLLRHLALELAPTILNLILLILWRLKLGHCLNISLLVHLIHLNLILNII